MNAATVENVTIEQMAMKDLIGLKTHNQVTSNLMMVLMEEIVMKQCLILSEDKASVYLLLSPQI
jgi:hypothetical protein